MPGSEPLENPKHEHFARLVGAGHAPRKAYTLAGYSDKGAGASAARLRQDAQVAARIAHFADQIERAVERKCEEIALDRAWVIGKLRDNALRAMQETEVRDREGNPIGVWRYEGMVACKALELLGKELGMFKQQVEHSGPAGGPIPVESARLARLSDAELEALAALARKLSQD